MKSLRRQLFISHFALLALMGLVMVGATFSFMRLGRSIDRIMKDNFKSVVAVQTMKDALERQDSATSFFLSGQAERARLQYAANWPRFQSAFEIAANNITERGEKAMLDDIGSDFGAYRKSVERLLYGTPPLSEAAARKYYFGTLEPAFLRLKDRADDVLALNQAAMVRADEEAEAEARRAAATGIAMTVGALLVSLAFALWMIRSAVSPLRILARQAEEIGQGHLDQRIDVDRTDEIGNLAQSFNRMIEKLREARRLEEVRLHRAERMSDAAVDSLYDPVLVTDSSGRLVHLNRAAEGLFAAGDGAGKPIAAVVGNDRIAEAVERAIREQHVYAAEDETGLIPFAVGSAQRTYRLRVTPMVDDEGSRLGAVAVLEDVTHLRELDRLKTEFIGVASHELRTPVTSLLMSARLLLEGAAGPLNPKQAEIVSAQREDLDRLESMMRDLLDLTRLEAGVATPRFEVLTPEELVCAAVESIEAEAAEKGVQLVTSVKGIPAVRADRLQAVRVFVNLLNNAVRHTPTGGRVEVSAQRSDSRVRFTVRDTGVGIPPEYLPRIFERFVQVPGSRGNGAGLGLSIAEKIAAAHGGKLEVESTLGRGSTFAFTLPLARPETKGPGKDRENGANTGC